MTIKRQKIVKKHSFKRLNHALTYYKWIKSAINSISTDQALTMRRSMIKELLIMKQGRYYYYHIIAPNDMGEAINSSGADYKWLKRLGLIKVAYWDKSESCMPDIDIPMDDDNVIGCTLTKIGWQFVQELFPEYEEHHPKAKAGSMKDHALCEQTNEDVQGAISVVLDKLHRKTNEMSAQFDTFQHKVGKSHLSSKQKATLIKRQYARCAEYALIQHLSKIGLPDIVHHLKATKLTPKAIDLEASKLSRRKMHHLFHGKYAVTRFKVLSFLVNHVWKSLSKDKYDYLYSTTQHRMFYHTNNVSQFLPIK